MSEDLSKEIIIIDNGSYECRVGWSTDNEPKLKFRNVLTKPRKDRKKEKEKDSNLIENQSISVIQVGNDITNIEAVRAQLKTPFDRNIITNWNHMEQILDYIFSSLGFEGQTSIAHPMVLTEALTNPNYCRQQMTELLFECYGVPGVSYGIDAAFSWQYHQKSNRMDALIISLGYSTTHVIPVLDGKLQLSRVRRLNVGGYHIITFLFRLMQMKYPVHINAITISRIESLVHQNCYIAVDYQKELNNWAQLEYYDANIMKIQLPYNSVTATNALLTAEQKQERRREVAMRLMALKHRRECEKLDEDKQQLQDLVNMRQLYEENKLQKFEKALQQQKITNLEALDRNIENLRKHIERIKDRTNNVQSKVKPQQDKIAKPPAGMSLADWLDNLRKKREEILQRKQARQTQRQEQSKRHTLAAQERMRIISSLARNEKRRKGEDDDDFGMNDDDWNVYKRISRYDDSDSDSDNEKLLEFEKIFTYYEPNAEEADNQPMSEATAAENYQLHFGLEAIRAPEILFQPSMIGCAEAGLAELIEYVLKLFPTEQQQRMVDNVILTGGCAQFRGLKERLNKELLERRPFQSSFVIYETNSPMLGAWLGASEFARSDIFSTTLTTRADYDEYGSEYFKEHSASNFYYPTPSE